MYTLNSLIQVLIKIAKAHTGEPHKRINSFALVDDFSAINSDNLRQKTEKYGWFRYGNESKKQYGVLLLFVRYSTNCDGQKCLHITLGVLFPENCTECPKGSKFTSIDAQIHAENTLYQIVETLKQFNAYKLCITDEEEVTAVLHPSELECLEFERNKGICNQFKEAVQEKETKVFVAKKGIDGAHLAYTTLTFCGCDIGDIETNFDFCKPVKKAEKEPLILCEACL